MNLLKSFFLFLVILIAIPAIADTNFSSDKKPLTVQAKKPEFTLTLQSNATTGYSWFLKRYNRHLFSSVTHRYVAPNSQLAGAPGYEVWTFKLAPAAFKVPQTTKIVMVYARPWEKHSGQKSVFRIYLTQ